MERDELKIVAKGVGAYPATWERWDNAATLCGQKRQDWIRDALNAAADAAERKSGKRGGR